MRKRAVGVLMALALTPMIAACSSSGSFEHPASTNLPATTTSVGSPTEPLLGTWRMEYTCEKFVRAFDAAGLGELAPGWLVGIGLVKSPVDRSAGAKSMCRGATRYASTTHFRPNGYLLRFKDEEIADDCHCYLLVDAHTFVSLGEAGGPDVSLRFTITGDELRFDVVRPDPCSTTKCRDAFAYSVAAYALGPWHRVS